MIVIIVLALFAFEAFNYSTTELPWRIFLGGLMFAGIKWSTILSIAFCGIDFAGIRLTGSRSAGEPIKRGLVPVRSLAACRNHECHPDLVGCEHGDDEHAPRTRVLSMP